MARPKSLGSYAPLSSNYYRDDAILEAGEKAELLFVRGLAYCAESTSDGFITDRQLVAVVALGMRDYAKRASLLVALGLWERVEGGYVVRSWLKWNKSAEDIGRALKRDRERKANTKPDGIPTDSERNPDGIQEDSSPRVRAYVRAPAPEALHDTTRHDTQPSPPRSDGTAITAQTIVGTWVDAMRTNGTEPSKRMIGEVARTAKDLLEHNDPGRVNEAARQAGLAGYTTIDRQLAMMNGRSLKVVGGQDEIDVNPWISR